MIILSHNVLLVNIFSQKSLTMCDLCAIVYLKGGVKVNERIKALRKELGLSQDVFAEKLGLTKNYISLVENGNRNLSEQSIKVLCTMFNVNEEWLRTGNGEMMSPVSKDEEISKLLGEVIRTNESDFRRRLISALARLDDKGWNELEKLIDLISENK